jgi:RNA polymerase sigma-70 factor, ECF subfamily
MSKIDLQDETIPLPERIAACRPMVFGICRHFYRGYPGGLELAEDATQDALIRAIKSSGGYRSDFKLTSWVHQVTKSTLIDKYRRSVSSTYGTLHRHVCIDDLPESMFGYNQFVDDPYDHELGNEIFLMLTPSEQWLISMWARGVTYEDMAVKMDIPLGTVKSQIFRIREKLSMFATRLGAAA